MLMKKYWAFYSKNFHLLKGKSTTFLIFRKDLLGCDFSLSEDFQICTKFSAEHLAPCANNGIVMHIFSRQF